MNRIYRRKSGFARLVLATAAVAAALLPAVARATPILPDPIYIAALTRNSVTQNFAAPGTYTLGGVSTTVDGLPGLSGKVVGENLVTASLESIIFYSFAVDGPLDGVVVPLFVTFTLHTSASGPSSAIADASARFVLGVGIDLINEFVAANNNIGPPTHPADFSGTLPFNQATGQVGRVRLQVDVRAIGGGVADAFADPFIFIDPDFLLSNPGYSVIVSAGIGNAPPAVAGVPEPATLALFASGLLGFVALRRRRI